MTTTVFTCRLLSAAFISLAAYAHDAGIAIALKDPELRHVLKHILERLDLVERDNSALKTENGRLLERVLQDQSTIAILEAALGGSSGDAVNALYESLSSPAKRSDDPYPLEAVVSQQAQKLVEFDAKLTAMQNSIGTTYTRWGHSQCPSGAETVYSGLFGGSQHEQRGAGANALCLTKSPLLLSHSIPVTHADLWGGEYETEDNQENEDPVCAVCKSPRAAHVMIPGTNRCVSGWTKEYSGFLMSGSPAEARSSEFICVDQTLESRLDSQADQGGYRLFYTVTTCTSSLPCPPYTNGKVVSCVVCSK